MILGFNAIIAFAIALVALFVLGKLLAVPIRIIIKLIINGIIGGITLFLVNIVGGLVGINIIITPVTAIIAGFLGVPGVVLLIIWQVIT